MPPVKSKSRSTRKQSRTAKTSRATTARRTSGRRTKAKSPSWTSRFLQGMFTYSVMGATSIAMLALLALIIGGYMWNIGERASFVSGRVAKAAGFSVTRVAVTGADRLSDREILDALRDEDESTVLGQSLLNLSANDLRGAVEDLGWVEHAAVQKLWPNTLHISVVERSPQAIWQDGQNQFYLIDENGVPLKEVLATAYPGYPVLSGTDAPEKAGPLLTILSTRSELFERVSGIVSVGDRRFDLRFDNGFVAKLPESDLEAALDRLEGLQSNGGEVAAKLKYLDLRDPKWAYYQPKEE